MLFKTAYTPEAPGSLSSNSSLAGSWESTKMYLSHSGVFFLLNHAASSVEYLAKRSQQNIYEDTSNQKHQTFGIESLSKFLEVFYRNRGFLAISRILLNINNAISGNSVHDRDELTCFDIGFDDQLEMDLYLRPVMTVVHILMLNFS